MRRHQKRQINRELDALATDFITGKSPDQVAEAEDMTRSTLIVHLSKLHVEPVQVWRFRSTLTGKFLPLPQDGDDKAVERPSMQRRADDTHESPAPLVAA